ncbi:MAG: hypothetical protein ACQXXD_01670 [Thermoplasmatota archaeon]|jgi:hypothetical protein
MGRFLRNTHGVSSMYDAVLFIVMVSLSGVILLPALQSNVAVKTSVDKHREHVADQALNTFLVSRVDKFTYKFCGNIIDDVAGSIGIDNSSDGLYGLITNWILAREQIHKNYANLITEDLGCQLRLPFMVFGTNRFNIFTGDLDRQLINDTKKFFSDYLGDKYLFNFTAWWHPIKGVPLGGEIYIGDHPPKKDCYVSQTSIIMPYSPVVSVGNTSIVFTRHWLKKQLFTGLGEFGYENSSIPAIKNIKKILTNYVTNNTSSPYHEIGNATNATYENVSNLVYGFLVYGISNETDDVIFPGIVNMSVTYFFDKLKNATIGFLEDAIKDFMGGALGSLDDLFFGLNSSIGNPIMQGIYDELNNSIHGLLSLPFGNLNEAFNILESAIKDNVTCVIKGFIDPYLSVFVENIFDLIDKGVDFAEMLTEWLFERISIDRAYVVLTIWEARG